VSSASLFKAILIQSLRCSDKRELKLPHRVLAILARLLITGKLQLRVILWYCFRNNLDIQYVQVYAFNMLISDSHQLENNAMHEDNLRCKTVSPNRESVSGHGSKRHVFQDHGSRLRSVVSFTRSEIAPWTHWKRTVGQTWASLGIAVTRILAPAVNRSRLCGP
jgi:hypothetical protein